MKVSEVWRTREFPGSIFDTIQQENAFIPSPGIGDESMEKHFTYISLSVFLMPYSRRMLLFPAQV